MIAEQTVDELVIPPAHDAVWSHDQAIFLDAAQNCGGGVKPLLEALKQIDPQFLAPAPGLGHTAQRLQFLAAVAAADVTAARVVEPHLDAMAILAESRESGEFVGSGHTWGVFAAEGPASTLVAEQHHGAWTLTGTKPWCSLGGRLSNALVTARTTTGEPRLFQVDLRQGEVHSADARWVARGLADVESGPLVMDAAAATPVGRVGWYLSRPGFRWGGIGVAACWWGGCVPLFAAIVRKNAQGDPKPLTASRVGRLYRALESARVILEHSAAYIDSAAARESEDADGMAVLAHTARGGSSRMPWTRPWERPATFWGLLPSRSTSRPRDAAPISNSMPPSTTAEGMTHP